MLVKKNLHWLLPLIFFVLVSASICLLSFWEEVMPVWMTNILSVAYFIFLPLVPLLKLFGLTGGDFFNGPSQLGVVIATGIYAAVFFLIGKTIQKVGNHADK